ncbi:tyrosine-protein phosphatase [Agrococcus sp. KRD186]|jgi:protein tyrosine/serine phosphatase|uniref:tyrosine-protein phosphatase n=1 Tax=Agrococcus sp. KRD186 TaxID=2729730 RepID=UPI0019CFB30A|nr:tyrosine-protein phosphatase [Agrococcus sp. KRD186]
MQAHELALDGTRNTRVFGSPAWLIRSAHLDDLTAEGAAGLREAGATVVVDLREPIERAASAEPAAHGLPVVHIPLYGLADGPPLVGSLEGVAEMLLADRMPQLAAAVAAIADADGAAIVHCAVGKDRTGLVVALALLAAGATREQVVADYARSGAAISSERIAEVTREIDALALDSETRAAALRLHLASPAQAMEDTLDRIEAAGGAERLLLDAGIGAQRIVMLRAKASSVVQA